MSMSPSEVVSEYERVFGQIIEDLAFQMSSNRAPGDACKRKGTAPFDLTRAQGIPYPDQDARHMIGLVARTPQICAK